jgi:hypothetical protein
MATRRSKGSTPSSSTPDADRTSSRPITFLRVPQSPGRLAESRSIPALPGGVATRYLYRASLQAFLDDIANGRLIPRLEERFQELEDRHPSKGELDSWKGSLPRLASVLSDERLRNSHIFVELRMPLGGRRCDALLSGRDGQRLPSAVVVELKAWEAVKKSAVPEDVGIGTDSRQHPSAQVRDYVQFLRFHHSAFVKDGVKLVGCSFLHEMKHAASVQILRDPVVFGSLPTDYPMFIATETRALADWLHGHLGGGDAQGDVATTIATGYPCASDKLLDVLAEAVQGTYEWRLLDEQRRAFMIIRTAVELARASGEKSVIVVRGGPGTGKSVLAIQLLAHGARKHWRVIHATGSQAFQTNLQAKTMHFTGEMMKRVFSASTKASLPVKELFCTFAHVAALKNPDTFDLVVADEAHRLWHQRMLPKGAGVWKKVEGAAPMVEEIIRASRVSAFFLDDNQSVRAEEIGRSEVIRDHANRLGVKVHEVDLNLQFRCNGSESYVHWIDALFGFRVAPDFAWLRYGGYDFHLDDTVQATADRLALHRNAGRRCRLVAGFCWPWSDPIGTTLVPDLVHPSFEGWNAPWIEKTAQNLPPLSHRYYRWANEDSYFEQVGSIYSVQGFEFDHVGVIWGEDLVWRDGRWRFDATKNRDDRFKRELKRTGEDPVAKLLNVYRVLLTRGMQGTSLYVIDPQTRQKVRSLLELRRAATG